MTKILINSYQKNKRNIMLTTNSATVFLDTNEPTELWVIILNVNAIVFILNTSLMLYFFSYRININNYYINAIYFVMINCQLHFCYIVSWNCVRCQTLFTSKSCKFLLQGLGKLLVYRGKNVICTPLIHYDSSGFTHLKSTELLMNVPFTIIFPTFKNLY